MAPAFSFTAPNAAIKLPLFSSSKYSSIKTTTQCLPFVKITMQFNQQQQHRQANWASLSSEINTHILKSLPTSPPPAVNDPMRCLISGAPPSVASALCLAVCELVGGQKDQAMNAACAIQLMHAAAHAHSQLLRHEYLVSAGLQLMTGDGILTLGYEMAARAAGNGNDDVYHERMLGVIVEITRAAGPQGLVEGQLLEAEGRGGPEWACERKGGRLSACGAACGAIMGGGRVEEVEKLRRFGWYVGMMNEMMMMMMRSSREINREAFRSLAMLELQGFDEGKVKEVVELFLQGDYTRG